MPNPNQKKRAAKTQEFLPFSAIYDDVVVLKNGEFRAIILVNALNFELKSQEEQDAIVFAFQGFLNSLSFPIQIVVRSRQIDLSDYLKRLNDRLTQESNELIRYQIQEYTAFMSKLISLANIMDKKFFVVIPFRRSTAPQKGFLSGFFSGPKTHLQVSYQEFQKIKEQLQERVNVVISGLRQLGISAIRLQTKQIIDLFYESYNITEAAKEKITSLEKLGIKSTGGPPTAPPPTAAQTSPSSNQSSTNKNVQVQNR